MTTKTYEVVKHARDGQGKWFARPARRFASLSDARAYMEAFAIEQAQVLSAGIRIDLRERAGRRTLATVGGLADQSRNCIIRVVVATEEV